MKIKWFWDTDYDCKQIGIQLNPKNKNLVTVLEHALHKESQLEVIQPTNDRKVIIGTQDVLMIEAMDHLSKLYTIKDQVFYLKGRLKDFTYLQDFGFFRINNSSIINLRQVASFTSEKNACLNVYTKKGQNFTVSRHYARQIKEAYTSIADY